MSPEDLALVKGAIIQHEGFSPHPIPDRHGSLSIGYGRSLTFTGVSKEEASELLDHDVQNRVYDLASRWPPFGSCDAPRQRCLTELAYQLGTDGLLGFPKFLHCVQVHDWDGAGRELQNSSLEHQSPTRVKFYVDLVRSA